MSQSSFSTNEAVSLEKTVSRDQKPMETPLEAIDSVYEIDKCAQWIKTNNFHNVCLQFPDYLLPDSSTVALRLEAKLGEKVYILGDTAYESCCIDYIAAAHINADAIIHFGPVCFSQTSATIPYLIIHEKHQLNIENLKHAIGDLKTNRLIVLVDTPYIHILDRIEALKNDSVTICSADKIEGLSSDQKFVFVGEPGRKLTNIVFALKPQEMYWFKDSLHKYVMDVRVLKRRNYLMEKIRDSRTIGIVIGTLGVKNYLNVIARMKELINLSRKKYYIISVGKPTVAKLANFPELDVYVMVTCAMNEIYDSRDFCQPIATPFDVEIALNNSLNNITFSYDYNHYIEHCKTIEGSGDSTECEPDVSLLTNRIRGADNVEDNCGSNQIMLRSDGTLALNTSYGAGFLADRTWKGLEQNLGNTEVEKATEGRRGLAQKYENENC
ncbi:unnamed protein product [Acanthoscelides obtectus]|uniref:2-(3-amino-3-carboxypropyl)histidine synthase n=1 Tax=Acanthoscelides obtectus TaxID=200917 RepID=A0A9P0KB27_ACAOB|nr:unnamed protein product [Acanthoscelides obtectus]CAK1679987.1 2-(3-amino-3-carboxypropyl)histidine synthase subunit 2 [Acanthoscelides obtectus]